MPCPIPSSCCTHWKVHVSDETSCIKPSVQVFLKACKHCAYRAACGVGTFSSPGSLGMTSQATRRLQAHGNRIILYEKGRSRLCGKSFFLLAFLEVRACPDKEEHTTSKKSKLAVQKSWLSCMGTCDRFAGTLRLAFFKPPGFWLRAAMEPYGSFCPWLHYQMRVKPQSHLM